jgi:DHA2 family methylenomycin A resistance protein-like MFS transporter
MRQTGSVIGVALFGPLVAASAGFLDGMKIALAISTVLAFCAAAAIAIWIGPQRAAG